MKTTFPVTHLERTWKRPIYEPDNTIRYELIHIDSIPATIGSTVKNILDTTIGALSETPSKKDMGDASEECSLALYKTLPFNFFDNAEDFDKNFREENEKIFYDEYLTANPNATPHELSELCKEDMLNCVSHSLIIKEVLQSSKWGVYALYSENQIGTHHMIARAYENHVIRIDPVAGSRKTIQGMPSEQVYIFEKEMFCKRYTPTPYIE
ncbi:MAG: hypothetical protein ACQESE_01510 [Nanobdellota archaeon]